MTKARTKSGGGGELRKKAEAHAQRRPAARATRGEAQLLHELEVHQIELEVQNEELRASQVAAEAGLERYTLLFDFAPNGYVILTPQGAIREINHAGAALLGVARSHLTGRMFEAYLATPERDAFRALLFTTLAGDTTETAEIQLTARGRGALTVQLTARTLTRDRLMVLVSFEDVTERRAREHALERAEQALREADRRKDDFLAALSHELRNPLAPMRTSLHLLDPANPDHSKAEQAYAILDRQVRHLTRLVEDLLDVTRVTRGKIRLERRAIDLVSLVRQTVDDHLPAFTEAGVSLWLRVDRPSFHVDADPARLVQALSNVLGNALKFTPRGGTVTVSVEAAGPNKVALRVHDTGAGVEPELLPHLFEAFVQGPRTYERSNGGVGLGLAMVKGLVELHGGRVTAASGGPGLGTDVVIHLPLTAARPAQAPADVAEPSPPVHRRVLLIDDNADHAEAMQCALELSGHEVRVALDGLSGLELARGFAPEVIISDIGLPRMDGCAVARAVRSDCALKDVYLIALSGFTRPEDIERSADAGFDRQFGKPAPFELLDDVIRRAPFRRATPASVPAGRSTPPA
jgi:two-component system CheB/CheR fusion protein